jgi:tetratricopeptide (TPR) repeat protein
MPKRCEKEIVRVALVSVIAATLLPGCGIAQDSTNDALPGTLRVDTLGLPQAKGAALQQALDHHDYVKAEGILLAEIQATQEPAYKDRLLQDIGGVYFLNHDDLNAAIAWKKAESIAPLPAQLHFSLAMAYVRIGRRDWARKQLQTLAAADAKAALYPYWLGRIDYDEHAYEDAITQFQKAIRLEPKMGRAYDNLGLCFFSQNENTLAVANFEKAIALDRNSGHPSAWPHINLAAALQLLGRLPEAEANLRDAIRLEPRIAQAHFQLGNVMDGMGNPQAAIDEYKQSAQLDSSYAEPHYALARVYRRLGERELAQQEVQIYLRLHNAASNPPVSSQATRP